MNYAMPADINQCILPKSSTNFNELVSWMETNVGPIVWCREDLGQGPAYAEGTNWFIMERINPNDGYYKIIITDYSKKIDKWYTELRLRWGE